MQLYHLRVNAENLIHRKKSTGTPHFYWIFLFYWNNWWLQS